MEYRSDNCIREIKCPTGAIHRFDYSTELNLIASFRFDDDNCAAIWNPDTGEIVQEIGLLDASLDILFLPGRYVGVAWNQYHRGSAVTIYSIDSGEEILIAEPPLNCAISALTPQNNLLIGGDFFAEFSIDFDMKKVVSRKRLCYQKEGDQDVFYMCCSKYSCHGYTVCYGTFDDSGITCFEVEFPTGSESNSDSEDSDLSSDSDWWDSDSHVSKVVKNERTIEYWQDVDGEEDTFCVYGLAHDGEHIIVGSSSEIIALESACDGSTGHVIVTTGISTGDALALGQIRVTSSGQLMVCNDSDVIKVYQYKGVNTLQGLCRQQINMMLKNRKDKIKDLPISKIMKNFLLYKIP